MTNGATVTHQDRAQVHPAAAAGHAASLGRAAELLRRRLARGGAVDVSTGFAVCDLLDALTFTAAQPGLPRTVRGEALALARRITWSDQEQLARQE